MTGLAASTLRYYESIGVIDPIGRDATSGHRVYTESDLDRLMSIACLSATGLSVSDMRRYVANGRQGPAAAHEQIELLDAQRVRLAAELEHLQIRQRYVELKIRYWHAVEAGDSELADDIGSEARTLAGQLQSGTRK